MSNLSVITVPRKVNAWEKALLGPDEENENLSSLGYLFNDQALASRTEFLDNKTFNRRNIYDLISGENPVSSLTARQVQNLEKVRNPKSCFVITGQQPGLLGGPIFWYYKALTAVKAAASLESRLGIPVIPLFWIAGDDSDLRECNRLELLETAEGKSVFSLQQENEKKLVPMSDRKLAGSVNELADKLTDQWSNEVMKDVRDALNEDFSFTESFRCLAQKYLGDHGMLFVDGNSKGFRMHTSAAMKRIIEEGKTFEQLLTKSSEDILSRQLQTTVTFRPDTVHAFIKRNGARVRIFSDNQNSFRAGNERYSPEQIADELSSLNITHDVVSRPVLIESLFPVLGHILGPNELGYFNQLPEVFKHFSGGMPLVSPRMTATVIASEQIERLKSAGFNIDELPGLKTTELKNRLIEQTWKQDGGGEVPVEVLFEKYFPDISGISKNVLPDKSAVKPETYGDFQNNIVRVWNKYLKRLKRLHFRTKSHQFNEYFSDTHWLANGAGQDRHLNILSLLNMLGTRGLDNFDQAVNPLETEHQIVIAGESAL